MKTISSNPFFNLRVIKEPTKIHRGRKSINLEKVRSIRLYGKNYWLKFELVQLINMKHSNCAVYTGSFQWVNEEFSKKKKKTSNNKDWKVLRFERTKKNKRKRNFDPGMNEGWKIYDWTKRSMNETHYERWMITELMGIKYKLNGRWWNWE